MMRMRWEDARPPRRTLTMTAWALATVAAGCTSDNDMTGPSDVEDTPGLIVSSLGAPTAAVRLAGSAALVTSVAYVSLVSGTAQQGVRADIRNLSTGLGTSVAMQDGGFDPVALPAEEGNTIEVTVHESDGGTRRFTSTAKLFRYPVVVRSGPTRGSTDVPLNSLIIIVFSEPMDPETVEETGMRLIGPGGLLVPLTVELAADRLTAVATPTVPLDAASIYTVFVEPTVTSANGLGLEETYQTDFTTTTIELPDAFVISIGVDDTLQQAGTKVQFRIQIRAEPNSEPVQGLPKQWVSLDPSVARVDSTGLVQGVGVGRVRIGGSIAGLGPFYMDLTFTPLEFTSVSAGGAHTCAITTQDTAFCWGANSSGQLGTGTLEPSLTPAPVAGGLRFSAITTGAEHSCGLTTDGAVYCWGSDEFWQLGRLDRQGPGTPSKRLVPTPLPHGPLTRITAGGNHTCASDAAGVAVCWGAYNYGEQRLYLDGPEAIEGGSNIESLASGGQHSCGVVGSAGFCWGRNDRGQLGDGTVVSRPSLIGIVDTLSRLGLGERVGNLDFLQLSTGLAHTCGLAGNQAYCWGDAGEGRLGIGSVSTTPFVTNPRAVAGGLGFLSLASGGQHTCGIATGGTSYCWGSNAFGQLGNGSRDAQAVPSPVAEGLRLNALVAGTNHACGLASDGLLYCWGRSVAGEIGSGFTGVHDIPTRVALQR